MPSKRRVVGITALFMGAGLSAGIVWIPSWRATALGAVFASGPKSARSWALEGLCRIRHPAALPGLCLALEDPDPSVAMKAAVALYHLGPLAARAHKAISERLKAPDLVVVEEPKSCFKRTKVLRLKSALNPQRLRCVLAATLGRIGARAPLDRESLSDELERRYGAVDPEQDRQQRLTVIKTQIQKVLEGPVETCEDLCRHKILALAELGPEPEQSKAFLALFRYGESEQLRATAAYALARIGSPARVAVPALRRYVFSKPKEIARYRRLKALYRGRPPFRSERALAVYALSSIDGPNQNLIPVLNKIIARGPSPRADCARWVLEEIRDAQAGSSPQARLNPKPMDGRIRESVFGSY